eukprot:TRINITY_DN140933_c0_g1_i1.p1 TRINITY_DN140933_c0_g1~~TRINITY_DN140933_c0_g1_i1.p1  ORF type:complete len:142 (-),score=13.01 TRINITY_DN140933_c0_g1_i1:9-434(-)
MWKRSSSWLVLPYLREFFRKYCLSSKAKKIDEIISQFPPPPHFRSIPKDWLAGFVNGDGCFMVYCQKNQQQNMDCKLDVDLLQLKIRDRCIYLRQFKNSLGVDNQKEVKSINVKKIQKKKKEKRRKEQKIIEQKEQKIRNI